MGAYNNLCLSFKVFLVFSGRWQGSGKICKLEIMLSPTPGIWTCFAKRVNKNQGWKKKEGSGEELIKDKD